MSDGWGRGVGLWNRGSYIAILLPENRVPVLVSDGYPGTKIPESPSTNFNYFGLRSCRQCVMNRMLDIGIAHLLMMLVLEVNY